MDRAFVDSASGNTTCVWEAPSLEEVTALFQESGVDPAAITAVEEVTVSDDS